ARALPAPLDGRRKRLFAELVAIGAVQAACMAAAAWASQRAFDAWILERAAGGWSAAALGSALLAAYLAVAGLAMRERVTAERLGQSYVRAVRVALFDRLGRLAPRRIHQRSRGGHLLRFIGDLSALQQWLSLGLARLVVAGVTLTIVLAALAFIAPIVAALVVPVLALGAAATLALGPGTRAAAREARRRRARIAASSDENIAAIATVQAFGQLGRERERLVRRSRRLARAMVTRARMVGAMRAVTDVTAGLATIAILAVGAYGVGMGIATPGAVISAMAVLGLCLPMLRDLERVHEYWQDFAVSRDNLRRFLEEDERRAPLLRGQRHLPCAHGEIRIEELCVEGALAGVSATARAGQHVALVGSHGAGKSTLLGVIARLLDADSGGVRIDGVEISECRLSSVRAIVGLVSPDLPLMRGTLEHNLRYRCPDAPVQELERVMALTGADEIVRRSPRGLATRVVDGGTNLSAGERQRVALARALLGSPRILLLDAADAHLDAHAAAVFDRAVDSFHGTVLMVTHDLARARRADWVWHLERGRVVGEGPPSRLLHEGASAHGLLCPAVLRTVA
ncbi:MAG TPA: ABC transporter ATP-binding protein, partial [Albitalea sp.]